MKLNLSAVVWRTVDRTVSRQSDLQEPMVWCIIGKQRTVERMLLEYKKGSAKTVKSILRNMAYTQRQPGQGHLHTTTAVILKVSIFATQYSIIIFIAPPSYI
ncbi:hypothetical protein TNCV_3383901 [Trichonephila clavipes]|uniref:Uncharacterized protein n=1 Tax=Trichonephila clavipes TaxID=2585209 RepID=A0A8X6SQ55_TRICX|nr:hypothetical protein TNCV_3383901 [Trichonephila clavipes]